MFSTLGYYICIPFAWLVRLFYNLTSSYGMAIILFTLVVKLILLPFQMKSKRSMIRMNRLSGKMQEIQKKYANNQAKMNEEIQKLYEEEGVSPMSGCLWSFLPLPILLALYSIMRQPITHFMLLSESVVQDLVAKVTTAGVDMSSIVQMKDGAAVVSNGVTQLQPYGQINLVKAITEYAPDAASGIDGWINLDYNFLGLDLSATPSTAFSNFSLTWPIIGLILIPILAGGFQLLMTRITMKQQPQQEGPGAGSTKMMMYMMPLMSVYIAFIMPAALGIYWIAQSVFSAVQEFVLGKFYTKKMEAEENARYEAIQADRQKRMEEGRKQQEQRRQETAQKQTLREKQKAAQKAKAAKAEKAKMSTTEAGRVGDRPYARGRSYKADRYDKED
ncbi:MAG: YidC/Oxa1 family membrane protein insertase [Dysosmobacter sp.]|nr:YidC/Oxa1 family membrane protein insertase [Dysosmobacter sp.]